MKHQEFLFGFNPLRQLINGAYSFLYFLGTYILFWSIIDIPGVSRVIFGLASLFFLGLMIFYVYTAAKFPPLEKQNRLILLETEFRFPEKRFGVSNVLVIPYSEITDYRKITRRFREQGVKLFLRNGKEIFLWAENFSTRANYNSALFFITEKVNGNLLGGSAF